MKKYITTSLIAVFSVLSVKAQLLAPVCNEKGLWGYIDNKGTEIIPFVYVYASDFSEDLAMVIERNENGDYHTFYIDRKGIKKITLPEETEKIDIFGSFGFKRGTFDFHGGFAAFLSNNGKWGFIDKSGKIAIECKFDEVGFFSEGLAFAEIHGYKTGYIDKKGNWQIILPSDLAKTLYNECACYYHGFPFDNGIARMEITESSSTECTHYETIYINKSGKVLYRSKKGGNFR